MDVDDNSDPVKVLSTNCFSRFCLENKIKIKKSQKRPNLTISQKDGKTTRNFNKRVIMSTYNFLPHFATGVKKCYLMRFRETSSYCFSD